MNYRNWLNKYFPLLIFVMGVLPGLILGGFLVWADIEASLFNATVVTNEKLSTLRCPLIMTPADTETAVRASFTNPSLENTSRLVAKAHVSAGLVTLIRESEDIVQIPPTESITLSWPLSQNDVVYNRFILIRVLSLRNPQIPAMTAACGVVFVDNPFLPGRAVLILSLASALALMGIGLFLWLQRQPVAAPATQRAQQAMLITAGLVVSTWVTGILGWWLVGVIAFIGVVIWAIALMDPISHG